MFKAIVKHFQEKRMLKDCAEMIGKLLETPLVNKQAVIYDLNNPNDKGREVIFTMDNAKLLTYFPNTDQSCQLFYTKFVSWGNQVISGKNYLYNEYRTNEGAVISRCYNPNLDIVQIVVAFVDGSRYTINFHSSEILDPVAKIIK